MLLHHTDEAPFAHRLWLPRSPSRNTRSERRSAHGEVTIGDDPDDATLVLHDHRADALQADRARGVEGGGIGPENH